MSLSFTAQFQRHPFLPIAFCWAAGILLAAWCAPPLPLFWIVALVAAATGLALSLKARSLMPATGAGLCFYVACLFAGGAWSQAHWQAGGVAWDGQIHTFRGVVVSAPAAGERSVRCEVFLTDSVAGRRAMGIGRRVMLTVPLSGAGCLVPGSAVCFRGRVEPPGNRGNPGEFDYAALLRRRGIAGTAFAGEGQWRATVDAHAAGRLPAGERLRLLALQGRCALAARLTASGGMAHDEAAVLAALTLGDKTALSREVRDLYAQTGVSHVLALSGLHLGILYCFLTIFLSGFRRSDRWRVWSEILVVLFVWSYVWLAGAPFSLVRSAVMYSLLSVGRVLWTPLPPLNNLAIAAFLILLWNPDALFDVGFQLSFAAVASILLGMPLLRRLGLPRHRLLRYVWTVACVSCCAQLGTAPLVAYCFHRLPVWFLVTNLAALPLVSLLVVGGFLFHVAGAVGLSVSWLAPAAAVLSWTAALLHRVLAAIASLPCATVALHPDSLWVCLCYVFLLSAWVYAVWRQRFWRVVAGLSLVACVGCGLRPRPFTPGVWFYNDPRGPLVHFAVSPRRSYLWTDAPARVAPAVHRLQQDVWEPRGLTPPVPVRGDTAAADFRLHRGVAAFGPLRGVLLSDSRWNGLTASRPLTVDFLYVGRGVYPFATLDGLFAPRLVVFDGALSRRASECWLSFCRARGWPLHALREQGACFLPLPSRGVPASVAAP